MGKPKTTSADRVLVSLFTVKIPIFVIADLKVAELECERKLCGQAFFHSSSGADKIVRHKSMMTMST